MKFERKMISPNKLKKKIEPYRVIKAEIFDIESQKKILRGYQAAYFSSAYLHLSLNSMQNFCNEWPSAVSQLKHFFNINLSSKI